MLSDSKVRALKPKDKLYKIADERGLVLLVMPSGSKLWRFRYRLEGKEQMLSLGAYPDITLADARARRDAMRRQLALGQNPAVQRRIEQVAKADTFEAIALEWFAKFSAQWVGAL